MKITTHICEVYESLSREEMASMSHPVVFDFIQSICASWRAKEKEIELLKTGIRAVRTLMDDSIGVDGLHLNGEVAQWETLESGGMFEEWLADFCAAEGETEGV